MNLGPTSSDSVLVFIAIIPRILGDKSRAIRVKPDTLAPHKPQVIEANIESPTGAEELKEYLIYADIQPERSLEKEPWNDGNVENDSLGCTVNRCERKLP